MSSTVDNFNKIAVCLGRNPTVNDIEQITSGGYTVQQFIDLLIKYNDAKNIFGSAIASIISTIKTLEYMEGLKPAVESNDFPFGLDRYFEHASGRFGDKTKFVIAKKDGSIDFMNIDGTYVKGGKNLYNPCYYVREGLWKEVFPRFFIHKTRFMDNTKYIVIMPDDSVIAISNDLRITKMKFMTKAFVLEHYKEKLTVLQYPDIIFTNNED